MRALSSNVGPVSRNIGCASDILYHCRIRSTGQIAWVPEGSYKPTVPIVIRIPGQLSLRSHNIVFFLSFWNKTGCINFKMASVKQNFVFMNSNTLHKRIAEDLFTKSTFINNTVDCLASYIKRLKQRNIHLWL